jgi:hypothetical protein
MDGIIDEWALYRHRIGLVEAGRALHTSGSMGPCLVVDKRVV